ncbi:MAG: serine hydrolase [Lachnospiraceae bacterium]|jgi:beta-lactamase class A|nr:serine hydrolase [Lachnospiraceae bacterium]
MNKKRKILYEIKRTVSLILVLIMACLLMFTSGCSKKETVKNTEKSNKTTEKKEDNKKVEKKIKTVTVVPSLNKLQNKISDITSNSQGTWSVYVKDLKTGAKCSINDSKMVSASLIKLYVMGAVYQKINDGTLEQTDEINRLLHDMITVSSNEDTNLLVTKVGDGNEALGMKRVTEYAKGIGCKFTSQGRDLQDVRNIPPPGENYTSVGDCGIVLEDIYRKNCVSTEASLEMLNLLKGQTRTSKIPAGVPKGTITANKTGELHDTENDVAIILAPKTDYILCIMSNNLTDTSIARANIVKISKTVYNYFNT